MTAPTAGTDGGAVASNARRYGPVRMGARGVEDAAPYAASFRAQREIRPPCPLSYLFKWQFENSDIFNFQLSIFNSPGTGCRGRPMTVPTAGADGKRAGRPGAAPYDPRAADG